MCRVAQNHWAAVLSCRWLFIGEIMRHPVCPLVFPAPTRRGNPEECYLPRCHRGAFAGMTDWGSSHLRDARLGADPGVIQFRP